MILGDNILDTHTLAEQLLSPETDRSVIDHPTLDQIRRTHLRLLPDYRVVSLVLNRDVTTRSPLQSDALTVFLLKPRRRRDEKDEGAEMQE